MHKNGVVHRDLKPENVLLMHRDNDEDFKIADFGLASSYNPGEELNQRCGSPGYVAPEILDKHAYGPQVDIFSAGIILYIL
jgi:serine/threonine protein kinase